jgi:DNA modification methylase
MRDQGVRPSLVYIDPPFATGRTFDLTPRATPDAVAAASPPAARVRAYDDRWDSFDDYLDEMRRWLEAIRDLVCDDGSLLLHCDHRAAPYLAMLCDRIFGFGDRGRGGPGFRNELIWSYGLGGSSPRYHPRKHDTILWYTVGADWFFEPHRIPATSNRMAGKLKKAPDVLEIPTINNMARERTGYPTQKPLALLDRLLACHAPPGSTVADLCCGSGTTLVAGHNRGHAVWGADIGRPAIETAARRLTGAGAGVTIWRAAPAAPPRAG